MNGFSDFQKALITDFISELLDDPGTVDQDAKLEIAELCLKLRDFRDGPKNHIGGYVGPYPEGVRSPVQVKQTPESAADISKSIREELMKKDHVIGSGYEGDMHGCGGN